VSVDGGNVWRKSAALEVELASVDGVTWSATDAAAGEPVDLVIRTLGFADDARVQVALFRHRAGGDDESLGPVTTPVLLRGGVARTTLVCGAGGALSRTGDAYAKVTVTGGGVERTATSPLLWVGAERAQVA
jgi:hypothetical protein